MLRNYIVHLEQKLMKVHQVSMHFLKAQKIEDALYSIEHLKKYIIPQSVSVLVWFKDPPVLPSSRGSATSPWARAGAAWPAMPKLLPICCKCAFVFEQMTQHVCMIYRRALLLNIVIMLPGRGTNFRSWKKSTHNKVLKYSKASSLSSCKFGSFTVGGLSWHTTEDLNVCLTITDKLVPLVQIPFLPTSGGRTCFRNFPALRWWKLTPDLFFWWRLFPLKRE